MLSCCLARPPLLRVESDPDDGGTWHGPQYACHTMSGQITRWSDRRSPGSASRSWRPFGHPFRRVRYGLVRTVRRCAGSERDHSGVGVHHPRVRQWFACVCENVLRSSQLRRQTRDLSVLFALRIGRQSPSSVCRVCATLTSTTEVASCFAAAARLRTERRPHCEFYRDTAERRSGSPNGNLHAESDILHGTIALQPRSTATKGRLITTLGGIAEVSCRRCAIRVERMFVR